MGIYVDSSSSLTLAENTITANQYGIYIWSNSSGFYQGNIISGNQYGIYILGGGTYLQNNILGNQTGIYVYYNSNNPVLKGNTYSNNAMTDLSVSGTINTAVHWGETGDAVYTFGGLEVAEGASLTIDSGKTIKGDSGSQMSIHGTLTATGVTFTWVDGEHQWGGILFQGTGSSGSRLENCVLEHAKGWAYYGVLGIITIEGSSPTITGCTVKSSISDCGILIQRGASPVVSNSTVSGMNSYGDIC